MYAEIKTTIASCPVDNKQQLHAHTRTLVPTLVTRNIHIYIHMYIHSRKSKTTLSFREAKEKHDSKLESIKFIISKREGCKRVARHCQKRKRKPTAPECLTSRSHA